LTAEAEAGAPGARRSLAARLVLVASLWSTGALVVAGFILVGLYRAAGERAFDSQLEALADAEGIAFLDLGTIWNRYLAASCVPPGWFHRDEIHANDRGKQVLARIMEQFFAPE